MQLLNSFVFRLALIQVAVFTLAVSLLLGLFYVLALAWPTAEVEASIQREAHQLVAIYRDRGADALADALEARAQDDNARQAFHVFADKPGHVVATNLPSWPRVRSDRWLRLNADVYRDGIEDDHAALTLDLALPGDGRLLVGRDIEDLERIERAVRRALTYGLPALLVLVVAGGALTSRAIGKRIEAMANVAHGVMEGKIAERVPLRGTNDDFDRLAATLNAMLDRIEMSLEQVRRVSDSVAHDLRTPLVRLQAELSELGTAPPRRRAELAARAQEEVERIGRMFDAVLRISRIEAKRHQLDIRPIDLSALLADAIDYHAPQAEERGQTLESAVPQELHILGDADLLFQAASNLIDNAIKFTPDGGRILMAARATDNGIEVTLTDGGPGIAPEMIAKVGERFFRTPAAAATPGFGLGLALAKAVAGLHDSDLRLENADPGLRVVWRFRPKAIAGAASA